MSLRKPFERTNTPKTVAFQIPDDLSLRVGFLAQGSNGQKSVDRQDEREQHREVDHIALEQ